MKRLKIKLGFHGYRHRLAAKRQELLMASIAAYWFWQGEYGAELNQQWRMK